MDPMKLRLKSLGRGTWMLLTTATALLAPALAFPPAPHHTVFGMVRDELGNPVGVNTATILMEVGNAVVSQTVLRPGAEIGANYRMSIPLDTGVTSDRYKPTALLPTVPFRLRVKIGGVTYLPIQMAGASALVTKPGETTRVDLTLGEDSDGDGLPDAWERAMIASMGGGRSLADIKPNGDDDGDGLSNLQEYLAGTYAYDPQDGFELAIRSSGPAGSVLEFTALRGRSYVIQSSVDMEHWSSVAFRLATDSAAVAPRAGYSSTSVQLVRAIVPPVADGEVQPRFFKLMIQ